MERRLLKPKEVEKVYNIDAGTLANWRCQGRGPVYVKYGRKVLYPNAFFLIRGSICLDIFVFL